MNINFSAPICDLDGNQVVSNGLDVTAKNVCTNLLQTAFQDEPNLSGDEKLRRFDLAFRIHKSNGSLELSVDDVAYIKAIVFKRCAPLIVGRMKEILDPKI